MKAVLSVLVVVFSLTACATHSPDVIHPYEAQRMAHLSDATILAVRPVTIDGYQTGAGAGIGAIAGGVAAANAASYHNSGWAGFLGAIAGGLLGNAVERSATTQNAVELQLQMRNGERRSIVQATGNEVWMVGEPVVLVTTGGRTRVTRAPQAGAQPVPQGSYPVPQGGYPAPQAYPAPAAMPAPVPVYPQSGPVPPRS
jgi:outer membrane lipoprotein SlyB